MKIAKRVSITLASLLVSTTVFAAKNHVEYLFTQSAKKVDIQHCDSKACDYRIELQGASAKTTFFTDRPNRKGGEVSTKAFVSHWNKGKNNFASDHPNASLVYFNHNKPTQTIVILSKPKLKPDGSLRYDVKYVSNDKLAVGRYQHAVLFIDGWGFI